MTQSSYVAPREPTPREHKLYKPLFSPSYLSLEVIRRTCTFSSNISDNFGGKRWAPYLAGVQPMGGVSWRLTAATTHGIVIDAVPHFSNYQHIDTQGPVLLHFAHCLLQDRCCDVDWRRATSRVIIAVHSCIVIHLYE